MASPRGKSNSLRPWFALSPWNGHRWQAIVLRDLLPIKDTFTMASRVIVLTLHSIFLSYYICALSIYYYSSCGCSPLSGRTSFWPPPSRWRCTRFAPRTLDGTTRREPLSEEPSGFNTHFSGYARKLYFYSYRGFFFLLVLVEWE